MTNTTKHYSTFNSSVKSSEQWSPSKSCHCVLVIQCTNLDQRSTTKNWTDTARCHFEWHARSNWSRIRGPQWQLRTTGWLCTSYLHQVRIVSLPASLFADRSRHRDSLLQQKELIRQSTASIMKPFAAFMTKHFPLPSVEGEQSDLQSPLKKVTTSTLFFAL